jgi:NAD(P)-dependent dehydrogenase (short-subunit alcohol dehydrogenase family)
MTGGTSGIGLAAAQALMQSRVLLTVGARGAGHVPRPLEAGAVVLPLDLASLESVRAFAAEIHAKGSPIDALVLNAGMQARDLDQRTIDGFETTFAVNHLAHYLLLRLLAPLLADGARVILTTSNLHDPRTNAVAPPYHADPTRLAAGQTLLDDSRRDTMGPLRAYAAAKLCNVMTAMAFAQSELASARHLQVIAFNPGFTPGTGLTRNHHPAMRFVLRLVARAQGIWRRQNTVSGGGSILAGLALGSIASPNGKIYASQVNRELVWPAVSDLARDDAMTRRLWKESAAMVGLPIDEAGLG